MMSRFSPVVLALCLLGCPIQGFVAQFAQTHQQTTIPVSGSLSETQVLDVVNHGIQTIVTCSNLLTECDEIAALLSHVYAQDTDVLVRPCVNCTEFDHLHLYVFKRFQRDRTCLLSPQTPSERVPLRRITKQASDGRVQFPVDADLSQLVQQLNPIVGRFRNVNGDLDPIVEAAAKLVRDAFGRFTDANGDVVVEDTTDAHGDGKDTTDAHRNAQDTTDAHGDAAHIDAPDACPDDDSPPRGTCDERDLSDFIANPDLFVNHFLKRSRPVVIKNAVRDWPASKHWSKQFLADKCGHSELMSKAIPLEDVSQQRVDNTTTLGVFEGCDDAANWGVANVPRQVLNRLESPHKVVVRPATVTMTLNDLLEKMGSSKDSSFYVEYLSLTGYFPELLHDVHHVPALHQVFANQSEILNIWIGDGKTLGKVHFDPHENLLGMVRGSKVFELFDPTQSPLLYEGHIREVMYDYHADNGTFSKVSMESTSIVNSPVDIHNPDLAQYPNFRQARSITCTVQEGDMLFVPAFWWHEVQSSPSRADDWNVAVNYWYPPFFHKEFPCPECAMRVNLKDYASLV